MKIRSIIEASHQMGNWLKKKDRRKSSFGPDKLRKTGSWGPKVDIFSRILGEEEQKMETNDAGVISIREAALIDLKTVQSGPVRSISDDISPERLAEIDRRIREEYEKLDES